jgi:hypothetical protein
MHVPTSINRATKFFFLMSLTSQLIAHETQLSNLRNDQAVMEVTNGQRTVANAAWWGFNREDSTEPLQAALNSGTKTLIIPFMGHAWITQPLQLRGSQEIFLEPGVIVLAKKGEYQGSGDSLFSAVGQSNLVIRGYGATLRMRKRDYQNEPYKKAEWRMGIALRGCRNVLIEGLRVESTGGDGFYIDGGGAMGWSQDITLRNCTAYDNHRQGLSVISAVNLLVENCVFANTWGTEPEAGIDLEPDTEDNRLVNCVIRNSVFENNNGNEILIYLKQLGRKSEPVSIRFEHCLARMSDSRFRTPEPEPKQGINGVAGIAIGEVKDDGPKGLIEFIDCVTEATGKEGARVYDKSSLSARVRFVNCAFCNAWMLPDTGSGWPRVTVLLNLRRPENTRSFGGIDFQDCSIYDNTSRPPVLLEEQKGEFGLRDVHGTILVAPGTHAMDLGTNLNGVDLRIVTASK